MGASGGGTQHITAKASVESHNIESQPHKIVDWTASLLTPFPFKPAPVLFFLYKLLGLAGCGLYTTYRAAPIRW